MLRRTGRTESISGIRFEGGERFLVFAFGTIRQEGASALMGTNPLLNEKPFFRQSEFVPHATRDGEIPLPGIERASRGLDFINRFGYQKMQVRVALTVNVGNIVDRGAAGPYFEVLAVNGIIPYLMGFALPSMLRQKYARNR